MRRFNQRLLENLHIPLWFLKDIAWSNEFKTLGMIMAIPTVLLAIHITILSVKDRFHFLPNLSVVFWILANCFWMLDEFFSLGIMNLSRITFGIGLATILFWIIFIMPKFLRFRKAFPN